MNKKEIESCKCRLDEMAYNNAIEGMPLDPKRIEYFKSLLDKSVSIDKIIKIVIEEHVSKI